MRYIYMFIAALFTIFICSEIKAQSNNDLLVYTDTLQSPWEDASWGAEIIYGSTAHVYSGTSSIEVAASSWGALSLHFGGWGTNGFDPISYDSLEFAVYGGTAGTSLTINFENDAGQTFPSVTYNSLTANQWTVISIPLAQLDPANQIINRMSFQDVSGNADTFYVDEIAFTGQSSSTVQGNQSGWIIQSSGTLSNLSCVSFADANNGTAVGTDGTIIHTTDGGRTWQTQTSGVTNLNSVYFSNPLTGTAVGNNGEIHTTDGGKTWTSQQSYSGFSVSFVNADTGSYVGPVGSVQHTTDGGVTWTSQIIKYATNTTVYGVSLLNGNIGTAVGVADDTYADYYMFAHTSDGGTNWVTGSFGPPYTTERNYIRLTSVTFADSNTVYAVGTAGTILKSTDQGVTWASQISTTNEDLFGVCFKDANNGTAVGSGGTILTTSNGGTSWRNNFSGTTQALYSVSFTNPDTEIIVGANGIILRTTSGGTVPPVEPALISPANGQTDESINSALTWNSVTGASTYRLQVSTNPSFSSTVVDASSLTTTSYTMNMLSNEATYYWRVYASGSGGSSDWSNTYSFTTVPLPVQPDWVSQSTGISNSLRSVSFVDSNNGIVVGLDGVILKTSNGGSTWVTESSGVTSDLYSIDLITSNIGFAAGNNIILKTTNGGSTWTPSYTGTSELLTISFSDTNNGIAEGNNISLRTTDGGNTWVSSPLSGQAPLIYGVSMANANAAAAVGYNHIGTRGGVPYLFQSSDGGNSWSGEETWDQSDILYYGVSMKGTSGGFAVGAGGRILTLTSTGYSGVEQSSITSNNLYAVSDVDGKSAAAVGAGGIIETTSDGGSTWRKQGSGVTVNLYGVDFVDGSTGWAVGDSGTIIKTSSGSQAPSLVVYNDALSSPWTDASWGSTVTYGSTDQSYGGSSNSIKVDASAWGALSMHYGSWGSAGIDPSKYINLNFAAYSSSPITLYISLGSDSGQAFPAITKTFTAGSWQTASIPISQLDPGGYFFNRITIQTGASGIFYIDAVNFEGSTAGAKIASNVSTESGNNNDQMKYALNQNYPNPFNPSTIINYQLSANSHVSLKIYDTLGREVRTLVNRNQNKGNYNISFNASQLASGVYIYRLIAGNHVFTKKMLLLK